MQQKKRERKRKKKLSCFSCCCYFTLGDCCCFCCCLREERRGRREDTSTCTLYVGSGEEGEKGRQTSLSIRKLLSLSLLFKSTHPSPKLAPQRRRFHILKKQLINLLTTRIQIRLSRPHKPGLINHFMPNIQHNKQNQR